MHGHDTGICLHIIAKHIFACVEIYLGYNAGQEDFGHEA